MPVAVSIDEFLPGHRTLLVLTVHSHRHNMFKCQFSTKTSSIVQLFLQKKRKKTKTKKKKYLSSWNGSVNNFNGFVGGHESRSGKSSALIGHSDTSNADAICFMHSIGRRNNVQLN